MWRPHELCASPAPSLHLESTPERREHEHEGLRRDAAGVVRGEQADGAAHLGERAVLLLIVVVGHEAGRAKRLEGEVVDQERHLRRRRLVVERERQASAERTGTQEHDSKSESALTETTPILTRSFMT